MRRIIPGLIALCLLISVCQAQTSTKLPRHAIYGEILGSGQGFTPFYEFHFLHQPKYTFSARIGLPIPIAYQTNSAITYATTWNTPTISYGIAGSYKFNERHALEIGGLYNSANPAFSETSKTFGSHWGAYSNYVFRIPEKGYLFKAGLAYFSSPSQISSNLRHKVVLPQFSVGHEISGSKEGREKKQSPKFRLVSVGINLGVNSPIIFGDFVPNMPDCPDREMTYSSISTDAGLAAGININLGLGERTSLRLGAQYLKGAQKLHFKFQDSDCLPIEYGYQSVRNFKKLHIPVAFQINLNNTSGVYAYGGAFYSTLLAEIHTGGEWNSIGYSSYPPDQNYTSPSTNFGPMLGFGTRFNIYGLSLNMESEYKFNLLKDLNGTFRQQSFNLRMGIEINFQQFENE